MFNVVGLDEDAEECVVRRAQWLPEALELVREVIGTDGVEQVLIWRDK